ncbi:UDP-glucose 4-epimerase GalE [Bacillus sp. JJ722]|uniref:UDP-glucose 4-epimerase GalE n=1 Tax=Bacillus sp. JJ722 TaxID=3122973 RepID=UPI0030005ACD
MVILVTGGAGYIGSHTCVELLNAGYEVVIVDNLSNSRSESLTRVEEITGKKITFYNVNILDKEQLENVFVENNIDAVMHFAGLKSVQESAEIPIHYYNSNITGTLVLCGMMEKYGVKNIVFSSSATVYGVTDNIPISENFPLKTTNPYARTKLIIEVILRDLYYSDNNWSISILRYFNPIGAHESGRLGEDSTGVPNNLLPYIAQVAIGKMKELNVYGNKYPTSDGTGIRDFIHVFDLAKGHLKALEKVISSTGIETYNLGTGKGYSVLEIIDIFEKISGTKVPYKIVDSRPGDVASSCANPLKAKRELGWIAVKGIDDMCRDAWRWQKNNPDGYKMKL